MAGTNSERQLLAEGPAIILVEPQMGENIGMVARAMANFGLAELRLVNPRDGWPNERAQATASKADHIIEATKVYETLEQAIADLNFVYATTARERDGYKPVRSPVIAAETLRTKFKAGEGTGILFGRERWGLTNEEVALADEIVTFPVNPAFASLNIAQAVLLMSYEWMKSGMEDLGDVPFQAIEQRPSTKEQLFGLFDQLEEALDARNYFHPAGKKPKMVDNLRAVLSRRAFTEQEISVLRGVISSLDRFSRKSPRGSGSHPRSSKAPKEAPSDDSSGE
ncbi:tRNA/rRNA methyltransferase [Rhizobium sp. ERR 922]|uniref:tRNA (cytidine/uridine-2'-O-)-methyltransferase TrmJ n=1 Tax=Rhizobium dioscoreae TaxID=2653122 RepID=A0ABQ0YZH8_9HYPH|nr:MULTISPECIES: RNA methyltransferase [Rhizobium]MCZ3378828.1 RNA methyltransferase [Rhizobium sp. AG207R]TWB61905.1 tRNA/rRNA methyltransferase [Rhizobium sp. ERR 922]TWC04831.1 tRNA/rRNA methyltransferase [Rhizobium sp. ERR 942]GES48548.1 tRNA (cytidine/uridine-2'-O-)-methyltransferase TrmJ [Rhizobium dioscoreae]GLU78983.1 tRNA (cytidine/uridine-2'-O-)-methyltransferase TrmJ [Rhizobium sp. NBRC 114257]